MDRGTALTTAIGDFAGWHLGIGCAPCRNLRTLQVNDLLRHQSPDEPLRNVLSRLRCQVPHTAALGGPGEWRAGDSDRAGAD